jgi:hypothetical protein
MEHMAEWLKAIMENMAWEQLMEESFQELADIEWMEEFFQELEDKCNHLPLVGCTDGKKHQDLLPEGCTDCSMHQDWTNVVNDGGRKVVRVQSYDGYPNAVRTVIYGGRKVVAIEKAMARKLRKVASPMVVNIGGAYGGQVVKIGGAYGLHRRQTVGPIVMMQKKLISKKPMLAKVQGQAKHFAMTYYPKQFLNRNSKGEPIDDDENDDDSDGAELSL